MKQEQKQEYIYIYINRNNNKKLIGSGGGRDWARVERGEYRSGYVGREKLA